jgi:ribosomal protein S12 methylthiotransferase
MDFVREQEFFHLGVFTYSREEGTAAYGLPDQLPEREKRRRRNRLMELQAEISLRHNRALVGKQVQVLVEGQIAGRAGGMRGRTSWQAPEIDGAVVLRGAAEPGEFLRARVKQALTYDLVAEVVGAGQSGRCEHD